MTRRVAACSLLIVVIVGVRAIEAQQDSVAGKWTMAVQDLTLGMSLTQSGTTIEGTLESPHGPIALKGQFDHGNLTLSGASPSGSDLQIVLSATGSLQADGSLAGRLTSNVGDMTWTAVREKEDHHK
jgi:hypothetical protein